MLEVFISTYTLLIPNVRECVKVSLNCLKAANPSSQSVNLAPTVSQSRWSLGIQQTHGPCSVCLQVEALTSHAIVQMYSEDAGSSRYLDVQRLAEPRERMNGENAASCHLVKATSFLNI